MFSRSLLLLLLLILAFLAACKRDSKPEMKEPKSIVLLSADTRRPYDEMQVRLLTRLALNSETFRLKAFDAAGNADKQASQLAEALTEKPFAILIAPVNPNQFSNELVAKGVKNGVLMIRLGEESSSLPYSSVLAVDQRHLGRLAGEIAARSLTIKAKDEAKNEVIGRIVEIRGDENSVQSNARHEGFIEAISKHPGLILVHDAPGQWTQNGGRDRATEALRLQSRFDVVYAHNDAMASGASTALNDQRQQVLIIGTDGFMGDEGGLSLVLRGKIDASIYHPPLVDLAWQIILQRSRSPNYVPKPSYKVAPITITPKSADDMRRNGPPPLPAP